MYECVASLHKRQTCVPQPVRHNTHNTHTTHTHTTHMTHTHTRIHDTHTHTRYTRYTTHTTHNTHNTHTTHTQHTQHTHNTHTHLHLARRSRHRIPGRLVWHPIHKGMRRCRRQVARALWASRENLSEPDQARKYFS